MSTKRPDICVKVMDNNALIYITVNRYIMGDYIMLKILEISIKQMTNIC